MPGRPVPASLRQDRSLLSGGSRCPQDGAKIIHIVGRRIGPSENVDNSGAKRLVLRFRPRRSPAPGQKGGNSVGKNSCIFAVWRMDSRTEAIFAPVLENRKFLVSVAQESVYRKPRTGMHEISLISWPIRYAKQIKSTISQSAVLNVPRS